MVDPMMRISIPEIRQHPWFNNNLPRYLVIPPLDTTEQAKEVRTYSLYCSKNNIICMNSLNFLLITISRLRRR